MTEDRLEVDRDALVRCIAACEVLAADMQDLRERAHRELAPESFGLGETHLRSAADLAARFRATAIGGPGVAVENSAVGTFAAHERYALDLKATFEAALARYDEQDAATAHRLEQL
ncbi:MULTISPECIES: hypothetical protein [Rhodococcus]|jgi:hypothetical protein|uniref:Uncharacterized protein n=1 Tax=Rhodococcus jostii (strain RHA1) TaxID=101510 RepID=Q0S9I8_RHOJR|nr:MULTISPECIES: hypothetical protein [Rhodococcus]ABG95798.1 hypothetical protein RHA1_ro04001 [Rhodococcus jostii RHA1]